MVVTTHLDFLSERDAALARYYAALSQYRAAAQGFIDELNERGQSSLDSVDEAREALAAAEEEALPYLMEPAARVAERLGYSRSSMRRILNEHGPDGDGQIRAEKRRGTWWVFAPDIEEYASSVPSVGRPRGPE
jgi:hypothetical protein